MLLIASIAGGCATYGGRAATPGAHWLEYVDWAAPILAEPLTVVDGSVQVPDRPGNGLQWDAAAVARYRL